MPHDIGIKGEVKEGEPVVLVAQRPLGCLARTERVLTRLLWAVILFGLGWFAHWVSVAAT